MSFKSFIREYICCFFKFPDRYPGHPKHKRAEKRAAKRAAKKEKEHKLAATTSSHPQKNTLDLVYDFCTYPALGAKNRVGQISNFAVFLVNRELRNIVEAVIKSFAMDPLSITSTVIGLTATCLQTAKALNDVKDKYQNAQLTISAIVTEATIISASLSRIQTLILGNTAGVAEKLQRQDLETTLDAALTGCYVVFDVLEIEVRKLTEASVSQEHGLSVMAKIRFVWSETAMQDILRQIRGLQVALTLLLQLFETDSIAELKNIMDNNTTVLAQVVQKTRHLRTSRESRAPESIFDMSFSTQSIKLADNASVMSTTFFTFDDELVNAPAYRRTLARAYGAIKEDESKQRADDSESVTNKAEATPTPKDGPVDTSATAAVTIEGNMQESLMAEHADKYSAPRDHFEEILKMFPSRSSWYRKPWHEHWQLSKSDVNGKDKNEALRQNVLAEIVSTELLFIRQLWVLKYLYRQRWMLTTLDLSIQPNLKKPAQFPDCGDILHANRTLLLDPILARETAEGPWVSGYWDIFRN
ncbi:hypothetical protein GGR57DRAFT_503888 [Xylariaceae sp. FL1272]|nr:hypothetical protein GGR57DRAFT_503888 [Xylariaceae sp. FL1272]